MSVLCVESTAFFILVSAFNFKIFEILRVRISQFLLAICFSLAKLLFYHYGLQKFYTLKKQFLLFSYLNFYCL